MQLRQPESDDSNPSLMDLVAGEIERDGPMTFARFMEIVISDPEHGYYASSAHRAGRSGDFLTAPETHFIFGWLVARQIRECWDRLGRDQKLIVSEHGAGRGALGLQILDWFSRHPPDGLESLAYRVDDLNPGHSSAIERAVEQQGNDSPVSVEPAAPGSFTGVVIANEFLDALPFHRLKLEDGQIRELYVTVKDGWFDHEVGELSDAASGALDLDIQADDGQRFEFCPAIEDWFQQIGRQLERGYVLIFDYGDERDALLDVQRFPGGTLKTYRQHQVGDDPFQDIGQRDITAHVDFTLVESAARGNGFRVEGITSQAEFVAGVGLDEVLLEIQGRADAASEYPAARAAAMELLNPGGLGRFRVAILSRNVDDQAPLKGLAFRLPALNRR
ncbi:MAG: SAM-dependent methyltransferase [Thermomicrobiales bacterium]